MISSNGWLTHTGLNDLLDLEAEAKDHPVARAYVGRVLAAVMLNRATERPRYAGLAVAIHEHCRRGYRVDDGVRDRFGYRTWNIEVPDRPGPVATVA